MFSYKLSVKTRKEKVIKLKRGKRGGGTMMNSLYRIRIEEELGNGEGRTGGKERTVTDRIHVLPGENE